MGFTYCSFINRDYCIFIFVFLVQEIIINLAQWRDRTSLFNMSKRKSWNEVIPQENLNAFESLLALFCSSEMEPKNSIDFEVKTKDIFILPHYRDLLEKPLSKFARRNIYNNRNLLKARIAQKKKKFKRDMRKSDTLFRTIQSCIKMELEARSKSTLTSYRTFGKKGSAFKELSDPLYLKRLRLLYSSYDIICLVEWKYTFSELVILASEGDDDSLTNLIRLSRRVLASKMAAERITLADEYNDQEFFNNIVLALETDTTKYTTEIAKIGFSMIVLWHLGFKELTNPQLRDFLLKRFGYPTQAQPSFNMMLYRLGLVRYRKR